ncbi:MAG: hypothetical protein GY862_26245, partial [Gammaproteobacteria bacterium]|nr:hypothetical protein [Gammaproteobacteria bacterium]
GDGGHAENLYLGAIIPAATDYGGKPAEILDVTDTIFLGPGENRADLRVTVSNALRGIGAPVDICVPHTALPQVVHSVTEQQEISEFKRIGDDMDCTQAVLPHECTLSFDLGALFEAGETPVSGTYEIFHFVRDAVTYEISPLRRSLLYKNYEENQAPGTFNLLFPQNGAKPQTVLITDWEQSTDPDGDALTYILSVAGDPDFTNIIYQAEELTESMAVIAADAGLEDQKTYYWKVTAVDSYGARTPSPVYFFTTDNMCGASPITIRIYDVITHGLTPGVSITPPESVTVHSGGGTHMMLLPCGAEYQIPVQAPGYEPATLLVDTHSRAAVEINAVLQPLVVHPVLSVAKYGEGSVSSTPPGIDCGADCTEEYAGTATQVILTALPAPHHKFTGWSGSGCAGNEPVCSLTMSGFRAVNAVFERSQYSLDVLLMPDNTGPAGYVSGPGIDCGADCEERYPAEMEVSLTAQPADPAKYRFAGWVFESSSEQHCMDGDIELLCRFALLRDETLTANFERLPDMALTLSALPSQLAPGENLRLSVVLDTKGLEADDAEIELRFPPALLEYRSWESVSGMVSSSPVEANPDCNPGEGCFNLRLSGSISGIFTVPVDFTALRTGTAEICFTANNRFLLNGSAVLHHSPGCLSVPVCPALGAAAIDANRTPMNTAAAFNACMSINDGALPIIDSTEIPFGREVRINGMISADPAHAEQTGDLLAIEVYLLDNRTIRLSAFNNEEGNPVPWNGRLADLEAFQHAVPLAEKHPVLINRTPFSAGLWQIFFGYRLAGGEIIFTNPPLTAAVACPVLKAAAIDANQAPMDTRAEFNACVETFDSAPVAASAEIGLGGELRIRAMISADPAHATQTGDILAVEFYTGLIDRKPLMFMFNEKGNRVTWNGNLLDLEIFQPAVRLAEKHSVYLNLTPANTGLQQIFFGYRLAGGEIIFTADPLAITVHTRRKPKQ